MKLSISRIFDLQRALNTQAGQQLQDALGYVADLSEQIISALNRKLNFADNFDCEEKTLSLSDGVSTTVSTSKTVTGVLVKRVISQTVGYSGLTWFYDGNGLNVKVDFTAPATDVDVVLIFLY